MLHVLLLPSFVLFCTLHVVSSGPLRWCFALSWSLLSDALCCAARQALSVICGLSGCVRACVPDTVSTHKLRLASSGEESSSHYRETDTTGRRLVRLHNRVHLAPPEPPESTTGHHRQHTTACHNEHILPTAPTTPPQHHQNRHKTGPKRGQKGAKMTPF